MIASFRLGPDGIYRCDAFQQFIWQEHGFGTRAASPFTDVTLRQIHSNCVLNAYGLRDREREGDALITNQISLGIGVRTADCVPILLLDPKTRAVAAVHAGWRGTASSIVAEALDALGHTFGTDRAHVHAAFGPCIRACCYEVEAEVAERFSKFFPEWQAEGPASRKVDLIEANRRQLTTAGVPETQIYDSGLCTTCLPEQFFSYRREPETDGRMLSSICRLA